MDNNKDYFLCDECNNKNFILIYNFSVNFRKVNFSDNLIRDEVIEKIFQCTHCQKTFNETQIKTKLNEIKEK